MKRVKLLVATVSAASLLFCGQLTSWAEEGWSMDDGDWKYLNTDDSVVTDSWKKGNSNWYYLDSQGAITKSVFLELDGETYYLDSEGRMAAGDWVESEDGWYYFGEDGKAFRRKGNKYKLTLEDKMYTFDEEGRLLHGWLDEDGAVLDSPEDWLENGEYYAGADGALAKNQWLDFLTTSENLDDYLFYSEATDRDYTENENLWMYFDNSGEKLKGKGGKILQKTINGDTYGFDENGVMNQWWGKTASASDATADRPISETPAKYYSGYDGGRLLTDTWFWMYPSESLDEKEYGEQECSWWYADSNGKVIANRIKTINGKDYAFDGIGRMQTGFVYFNGRSDFVAQYDVDAWESEDFINGNIYGDEKADLYFFNIDELNDGSMQAGRELQIQLANGTYTFGFADNGKALGGRNKLQKKSDSYYINGLRLDADSSYRYGVVQSSGGENPRYQVVDENGKIITGKRKILTDKSGGYLLIVNDYFKAYVMDDQKPRWRTGEEGTGYYHYNKDNKDDPYVGGLIAGSNSLPSTEDLAPEHRLNFD